MNNLDLTDKEIGAIIVHCFSLPTAPPSLNAAFANSKKRKGRHRTDDYNKWIMSAGWELKLQRIGKRGVIVKGPYGLDIEVGRELSDADIDNLIKPIADLLVKLQITDDDRKMDKVSIERTDIPDIQIKVFAMLEAAA